MDKIIKKENNEFENIAGPGATNSKVVHDKILRTLNNVRNITKQYNQIKLESDTAMQKGQIAEDEV